MLCCQFPIHVIAFPRMLDALNVSIDLFWRWVLKSGRVVVAHLFKTALSHVSFIKVLGVRQFSSEIVSASHLL